MAPNSDASKVLLNRFKRWLIQSQCVGHVPDASTCCLQPTSGCIFHIWRSFGWLGVPAKGMHSLRLRTVFLFLPQPVAACLRSHPAVAFLCLPRLLCLSIRPVPAPIWRRSGKSTSLHTFKGLCAVVHVSPHLQPLGPGGMSQLQSLCESLHTSATRNPNSAPGAADIPSNTQAGNWQQVRQRSPLARRSGSGKMRTGTGESRQPH